MLDAPVAAKKISTPAALIKISSMIAISERREPEVEVLHRGEGNSRTTVRQP